tara:strand:+ start:191 stop:556 length:366 start_codon:yes stop_codon:yes gene_type:complete
MTLANSLKTDAVQVFLRTDDFAETVSYHPHTYYGGTPAASREIVAVVERMEVQTLDEGGNAVIPMFQVHVANNATTGISSDEIDTGGDQLSFAVRNGEAATRRSIISVSTQDSGMLVLQCR